MDDSEERPCNVQVDAHLNRLAAADAMQHAAEAAREGDWTRVRHSGVGPMKDDRLMDQPSLLLPIIAGAPQPFGAAFSITARPEQGGSDLPWPL